MASDPILGSELFSGISPAALEELRNAAHQANFSRGEVLLRQGDTARKLYFIQSGRFKVVVDDARTVAHVAAGEVVGELAFFAGGKRTASVIATRDAVVLGIDRDQFDAIAEQYRELPQLLLKLVSERLAESTRRTRAIQQKTARVIGLLPTGRSQLPDRFVEKLSNQMVRILAPDVSVVTTDETRISRIEDYNAWLAEAERERDFIVVDCSGSERWAEHTSRNVDALLLVADVAAADASRSDIEQIASQLLAPQNRSLVIYRDSRSDAIQPSSRWLDQRELGLHHHLALDHEADFAKLARFLCGRATGLVLAGGGALGCAHLGVIKALQRADIAIDFLGGASAGAAMAAAIARGMTPDDTLDQMESMFVEARALKRLTIPVHSLLDPAEFDLQLQTRYGFSDVADLPTLFFAVSTNLSTSAQHVHRRGPLWEAVRASGSLPTILPPFIDETGNVLVDGGVLDNLPVNVMSSLKAGPNIAVALDALDANWFSEARYDQIRGPAALLRDIALRRKPRIPFPSLFETTQRSMVVTSRMALRDIDDENNIVITVPRLPGMQILDWQRGRELAELAERYVTELIAADSDRFAALKH